MKFTLTIDARGAAFTGRTTEEIAGILREVAERLDKQPNHPMYRLHQNVRDVTGEIVGTFVLKPEPPL